MVSFCRLEKNAVPEKIFRPRDGPGNRGVFRRNRKAKSCWEAFYGLGQMGGRESSSIF